MKILGLHHVFLPCTSVAETRTFYTEVLGMSIDPEGPRTAEPGPGLWFRATDSQQVHVKENGAELHVAFEVVDLAAAVDELEVRGIEVALVEDEPAAGVRQATFRDPSGMLLEIFERTAP